LNSSATAEARTSAEEAAALSDAEVERWFYDWSRWAFPKQLPPAGDWTTWLLLGGRGSGKTRAGAEWVRSLARQGIGPIALVGETMTEAISIMVRGESGILNVHADDERPLLRGQRLLWPNGVEAAIMSASDPDRFRGPQFAAAWCDELGCGAVDKGANQPNIFGDSKSMEGGRPYFSSGSPDPLIQRQFLRAHHRYWRDPAKNPPGMVDVSRIYAWTWDARPYPAFPALTEVWSDGINHRTGHWLTGRLGVLAPDELACLVAQDHGVELTADVATPLVQGYLLGKAGSGRDALEPLLEAAGMSLRNLSGTLHAAVGAAAGIALARDDLVATEGALLTRRRSDPAEAPGRLTLSYTDRERDYPTGTALVVARPGGPLAGEALNLTLDAAAAQLAAQRLLEGRSPERETVEFALPPAMLALEPGDLVELDGLSGPYEVTEIRDGAVRSVSARAAARMVSGGAGADRPLLAPPVTVRSTPMVIAAHLPALPGDPSRSRLVLAGYAQPWPGALSVTDATTGATLASISRRAAIGAVTSALPAGSLHLWDAASFEIELQGGHLADGDQLAVMAGRNRLAVQLSAGAWEVLGFAEADLVAPGRYRLSRLLRGLDGTMPGAADVGGAVFVLDGRVINLPVEPHQIGTTLDLRIFGGASDLDGFTMEVPLDRGPCLPLPPAHLRGRRQTDGSISLQWQRRSRADGNLWGAGEPPLEHTPERYEVTILDDGTPVRSLVAASTIVSYAAAAQLADFGSLSTAVSFGVAQVSPLLGSGHLAPGEFNE
jgi:hypothetical protein